MTPEEAVSAIISATPEACNQINLFSSQILKIRGGRVGSGMGTLLESLWGFYTNQVISEGRSTADCEIGWLPDNEYNDFVCIRRDGTWDPSNRTGELLRIEAKSMNTNADESKGHFDELVSNLGQWDLLLVLAWYWKDADGTRVYPWISDYFIGAARSVAILRDWLHLARGGSFVDRSNCPDKCAPAYCTHHGEPLNASGTRERLTGPKTCKSKTVSYAANFGGLVRMLKVRSSAARRIFHEACDADETAKAYAAFVQRTFVQRSVPSQERGEFEPTS